MADWIPINLNAIFPPVDSEIQIQQIQQNLAGWPDILALNKYFCDFFENFGKSHECRQQWSVYIKYRISPV